MIDNRLLIKDLESCIQKLGKKGVLKEELLKAQKLTLEKNKSIEQVDRLRSQRNQLSQHISKLITKKEIGQTEQNKTTGQHPERTIKKRRRVFVST